MSESLIRGFDHAMIAVRDLDDASKKYSALGFEVESGGHHPGRGTKNALLRFGWGFIELIEIYDPAERAKLGKQGEGLTNFLKAREGGLVDMILETRVLDDLARRFAEAGVSIEAPFPLGRVRPDGFVTRNRILPTGPVSTRHLYPGIIEWERPDPERLMTHDKTVHPNGAAEVVAISVIVNDMQEAVTAYRDVLAMTAQAEESVPELGARRVRCKVGPLTIDLLAANGAGVVDSALSEIGQGPFEIGLRVDNLERSKTMLTEAGMDARPAPGVARGLILPEANTFGVRIMLLE